MRKEYLESWAIFAEGRGTDSAPPLLGRRPSQSELEGIDVFRTQLEDESYPDLTLPHLFVCRTLVRKCSFRGSDLSQSVLTWSDFEGVDFSGTDLHDSDLRNSNFEGCQFDGANLEACDLRGSTFVGCSFAGARTSGVVITSGQDWKLALSPEQFAGALTRSEEDAPGG